MVPRGTSCMLGHQCLLPRNPFRCKPVRWPVCSGWVLPQVTHTPCVCFCASCDVVAPSKYKKNMSKNRLWRFLGEYWNKWNCTCLICSWYTSWSLITFSRFMTPSKTSQTTSLKSLSEIRKDTNYIWAKYNFIYFNIHRETTTVDFCPYIILYLHGAMTPQEAQKHAHRVWVTCGDASPLSILCSRISSQSSYQKALEWSNRMSTERESTLVSNAAGAVSITPM